MVSALLLVQEQNDGWLSKTLWNAVAEYLGMARIEVFEVATFYDMYDLNPRGRHKISLCTNISCMLRGAENIADSMKKRLGITLAKQQQMVYLH